MQQAGETPAPRAAPLAPAEQSEPDSTPAPQVEAQSSAAYRVRQLIATLHDRIELEQLRAAGASLPDAAVDTQESRTLFQLASPNAPAPAAATALVSPELLAPIALPASVALPTTPIALSIPLAIAGQFATLQLVVQREPDGGGRPANDAPPAVRASFTLHLRRLGEVGADLRLQGPQVRCRLRSASPEVAARLSDGLAGLRERLEQAGLDVRQLECLVAGASMERVGDPVLELRHVAAEV
jgi:hypothetical protein